MSLDHMSGDLSSFSMLDLFRMEAGEQARVLRMIPGLEQAEFVRFGMVHRNTFINSPRLLDKQLRLRTRPHLRFAGQITGVEGYVESAAIGLLAGRFAAAQLQGIVLEPPPPTTACSLGLMVAEEYNISMACL
mgnify:CR=1 FL=1